MAPAHHITLTDCIDRWRYTCPRGHRSWEPTNSHFWCQQCARTHDTEPTFAQLRDRKNDRRVDRAQIDLR
jgi:hypothetical protein